jgi:hypothetical protein
MRTIARAFSWAVLGLAACHSRAPKILDAGARFDAAEMAGTSGPAEMAPTQLEVTIIAELLDAGTLPVRFSPGERPEIPPAQALLVETNLPLQNYRLRAFDEADRAMVSDDRAEDADGGIRYRIRFPEPLKSGHRYALVLDAQTGPQLLDSFGRSHQDVRLELRVAGERAKEQPAPKRRRRR